MPHTPFQGEIPDDRLYCPRTNMWVQPTASGDVLIGASRFGLFLAGNLIAFTSKPKGAEVARGRGMGTVESRKTVIAIHAPISYLLLAGNDDAEEKPRLIEQDPYGAGWMARAQPLDWATEHTELLSAADYRAHILTLEPEATFG